MNCCRYRGEFASWKLRNLHIIGEVHIFGHTFVCVRDELFSILRSFQLPLILSLSNNGTRMPPNLKAIRKSTKKLCRGGWWGEIKGTLHVSAQSSFCAFAYARWNMFLSWPSEVIFFHWYKEMRSFCISGACIEPLDRALAERSEWGFLAVGASLVRHASSLPSTLRKHYARIPKTGGRIYLKPRFILML